MNPGKVELSEVIASYAAAEKEKESLELPKMPFPVVGRFIPTWELDYVSTDTLAEMESFVSVLVQPNPTTDIYRELKTTKMGEIAEQMNHLKSLKNPRLKKWISSIDQKLYERILTGDIAPIILISSTGVEYGNVPEGMHRSLAAIRLAQEEKKEIKIPAYIGSLDRLHWILWNSGILLMGNAMPISERLELMEKRGISANTLTPKGYEELNQKSVLSGLVDNGEKVPQGTEESLN